MNELKSRIKEMIVTALELEDVTAADIVDDAPLFGESENGLGLDSIDRRALKSAGKIVMGKIKEMREQDLNDYKRS